MSYDHKAIEQKWQKYWKDNKTFKCEVDRSKPKYYVLDMFPYPSGSGLHVGHVVGYTATDILARYKRQKGFNVLHPMGWDSFGLAAEQYAVRTGTHPALSTKQNIDNFRRQLQSLGFSYDWDREVTTSSPDYYKWTQWLFTKLYEKGLAYEAELMVNYCPALGTVLANEEVENGKAKEGGHLIERRPLRQWVLKITAYADRLLQDLDLIDWPESLKKLQANWIGRSEGALVHFQVQGSDDRITVFTTRADTLFGATYVVLAPEHPLVAKITTPEQLEEVKKYQELASSKSDMDRTELNKEKTGAFTGAYAKNPVNGKWIPIWIADYVLLGYGSGAVMAVPAHDERDFEFAQTYALPVVPVIQPHNGEVDGEQLDKILAGQECWGGDGICFHSHNDEVSIEGLSVEAGKKKITEWLKAKGLGEPTVNFKLRDWLFSRQRYWGEPFPILHLEDGSKRILGLDELPLVPPEVQDYKPSGDGQSPLAKVREWVEIVDPKTGKKALRETNTMPQWAGSCWYYLRFADPTNSHEAWSREAESYWLPVDLYVGGVEHAVLHLLYARFWHKVFYDCGLVTTPEPFQSLRNQGLVVARSYQTSSGSYVEPSEVEEKGNQFIHQKTGEVLRSQIDKMSKSKLNGVTPDDIIEEYGADALRLYEMFMGPLEKEKVWNTDAVNGCKRFLNRVFDMVESDKISEECTEEALKLGYRLVDGVCGDVESLQFNTAIAKMMEFMNDFTKLEIYPKKVVLWLAQALQPFAPHAAEEIWHRLGGKGELSQAPFPQIEEKYLVDDVTTYVVQINGKVRGRFELPLNQTEGVILEAAKKHPQIAKTLGTSEISRVIFVPNKLLNIVTN